MAIDTKSAPIFALLISGGLLIGAWVFQYGFGYAPCTMCYWQRHAHKIIIGLGLCGLIISYAKPSYTRGFTWLLVLGFLGSVAMGFWHAGVEYKWWDGPKTCAGGAGDISSFDPNDPLAILEGSIKPPACSDAVWHFLGLSMASWNAIVSLGGALLMFILARKGKSDA